MIFTLSIHLGNDAMQTPADLALALRELADKVAVPDSRETYAPALADSGAIRDVNGNTVGTWDIG